MLIFHKITVMIEHQSDIFVCHRLHGGIGHKEIMMSPVIRDLFSSEQSNVNQGSYQIGNRSRTLLGSLVGYRKNSHIMLVLSFLIRDSSKFTFLWAKTGLLISTSDWCICFLLIISSINQFIELCNRCHSIWNQPSDQTTSIHKICESWRKLTTGVKRLRLAWLWRNLNDGNLPMAYVFALLSRVVRTDWSSCWSLLDFLTWFFLSLSFGQANLNLFTPAINFRQLSHTVWIDVVWSLGWFHIEWHRLQSSIGIILTKWSIDQLMKWWNDEMMK
jgi:hypothetical protein